MGVSSMCFVAPAYAQPPVNGKAIRLLKQDFGAPGMLYVPTGFGAGERRPP